MKKTDKMLKGIATAVLGISLVGCSSQQPTNVNPAAYPDGEDCDDWEWDDDAAVYGCTQSGSAHYGSYYYGGRYYSSKSELKKDTNYQNYRSSYTNVEVPKKVSTSKSSGFGSGIKSSFGG